MKKLFLAFALAGVAVACKSQTTAVTDTSMPATECTECPAEGECTMKTECSSEATECATEAKVCPVTGKAIN